MAKDLIERLLSYPQRSQIQIDFDLKKKSFQLKVPIFSSRPKMSSKVREYVSRLKEATFRPHLTSYQLEETQVFLVQEFPFDLEFQASLRSRVDQFWKLSQTCHKMLSEMAAEELLTRSF